MKELAARRATYGGQETASLMLMPAEYAGACWVQQATGGPPVPRQRAKFPLVIFPPLPFALHLPFPYNLKLCQRPGNLHGCNAFGPVRPAHDRLFDRLTTGLFSWEYYG